MTLRPAFRRQGRRRNFPNRTNFSFFPFVSSIETGRREKNLRWKLKFLLFLALASALAARKGEESSFKAENSSFPGSCSSLGRPEGRRIFFESRKFSFSRLWLQTRAAEREKNLLRKLNFPLFSVCLLLWCLKKEIKSQEPAFRTNPAHGCVVSKLKIENQVAGVGV